MTRIYPARCYDNTSPKASVCGMPPETWTGAGLTRSKSCPDCSVINKKKPTAKCLSCDDSFIPGCKLRFICAPCHNGNKARAEMR